MQPHPAVGRVLAALVALVALVVLVSCGGDGASSVDPGELGPEASAGQALVEAHGCLSCHSTDGASGIGPTWRGMAGEQVELADGRRVLADADYLLEAILDPDAEVVAGFPEGLMSAAIPPGSLSESEALSIVTFLETLQ